MANNAEWQKQRYRDRIGRGLCHICNTPRGEDGTSIACRKCADKIAASKALRIGEGLCRECKNPRGEDGTKTCCRVCAERNTARELSRVRTKGCRQCDSPLGEGSTKFLCRGCADAKSAELRERVRSGMCWRCNRPRGDVGTGTHCRDCADKNNGSAQARMLRGFCRSCGNLRGDDGSSRLCRPCLDRQAAEGPTRLERRRLMAESGRCVQCGSAPTVTSGSSGACARCYFRRTASSNLGTSRRGGELKDLWESQEGVCPYTGKKLELGKNASIDHILPKSRFPEYENDIENLEWVDQRVNEMKNDLTKVEFLILLATIVGRLGPDGLVGRPTPGITDPT